MKIEHIHPITVNLKYSPLNEAENYVSTWPGNFEKMAIANIEFLRANHKDYEIAEAIRLGKEIFVRRGQITFPFETMIEHVIGKEESKNYRVLVKLERKEESQAVVERVARFFLLLYLHEIFLLMNLSLPGSLSLISLNIEDMDSIEVPNLSSYEFSRSLIQGSIFPITFIDLEAVQKWYKSIDTSPSNLPSKSAGKALNVLIRLSYSDYSHFRPELSLLVTYAVEALFGGGIPISLLKKRVIQHFNAKVEKPIKNVLDEIYKWRNKLVHGELLLPHPLMSDFDDHFSSNIQVPYFEVVNNGFQLIVSTIQSLIMNNSDSLMFSETRFFNRIEKRES